MRKATRLLCGAALACASCARPSDSGGAATAIKPSAMDATVATLQPVKLTPSEASKKIDVAIASHYQKSSTRRSYIMSDKPLYQPGESIWFRVDLRATGTLASSDSGMNVQLVSPRGAIVAQKRALAQSGVAQGDFELPAEIEGGEYSINVQSDDGTKDTRKIVVNTYEAPRLKKSVEFVRKAYGEGDKVSAAVEVKRATGEAFADKQLTGVVTVDDVEVQRVSIKTDKEGKATAKFELPAKIARGDGLLTLLVDDGGVTESIQKRIPIVMKTLGFGLFPEGGELVEGLTGRVYFMAKNTLGKPADVEGRVVDDRGTVVADLKSIHDGLGRFELTPAPGRKYKVEITKPAGITATFEVPAAKSAGCVLRGVDGEKDAPLRVVAMCDSARTLLVEAVLREKNIAGGSVDVAAGKPALLELPIDAAEQGAVRVTLFSNKAEPLAERLVYRGRGKDLRVSITADKKSYSPRDKVKLRVLTTDTAGKAVQANVGVGVVDDTVLSFADDKSARLLAHLYLEPELAVTDTDPIEEPNFYFSDKPEAPAAMDALLATRGWRKFEWQQVFEPPPPQPQPMPSSAVMGFVDDMVAPMGAPPPAPVVAAAPAKEAQGRPGQGRRGAAPARIAVAKAPAALPVQAKAEAKADKAVARRRPAAGPAAEAAKPMMEAAGGFGRAARDGDFDEPAMGWAPVRVFPVPEYTKRYDGPRTDFRETIYWNPSVQTRSDGTAEVSFYASDAVTSFRATAEGFSTNGLAGGGQAVIASKMPLALDAHLPLEVTSGDEVRLPITLTNETDAALDGTLDATFGAAFKLLENPVNGRMHLAAGEKKSLFVRLKVVATDGEGDVNVALSTLGMKDSIKKKIRVVPLGFPFESAVSGTAKGGATATKHEFELGGAMPGSIHASVTMFPSPIAAMTKGMEGMLQEPGGCFEQTSSTNYPNVMILDYLGQNDASDAALAQKSQGFLDRGYKLLTGYETPNKGYEWFGKSPGHEALTAYGLMEFADMSKVYDVDRTMVERTANWLMTRRDGKGGFLRSTESADSFGRANETTTNAYIMWALAEAKRAGVLEKEMATSRKLGAETKDPYLLGLAANTMLAGAPKSGETDAMVKRLATMQTKDGSFPGAKETITMSGGESLVIETTAVATLAFIKASPNNEYEAQTREAVSFLNAHRGGYGAWGNTQATILALKALSAYASHARQMQAPGKATLVINGKDSGTIAFDKGRRDALVWNDFAASLRPGHNTVEVRLDSTASLPYSIAISHRSALPQSSQKAKVSVTTSIDKGTVKMGEGVKVRAHIENKTTDGVPMTLARVGIPGGLVFQTWQLKELRDKGVIDFYETKPREVILYWRALAPSAKKDVELALLAQVPGSYEAPASSAYLYYTAEDKAWTAPVKVTIER